MSEYKIKKYGTKLLDEYRGDRVFGDLYSVIKEDEKTKIKTKYNVMLSTLFNECDCPGWTHHGKCKHVQMVFDHLSLERDNVN